MAKAKFYTYIHRKADTGAVFYVGKGSGRRISSAGNRNKHWKQTVAKYGFHFEMVAMFFDEQAAFEHEIALIAEYRELGATLANYTNGGQGHSGRSLSEEVRRKISNALSGGKWSAIQREACERAIANRGPTSEETRLKISNALKGSQRPKGIPRSAEVRAKISASLKGKSSIHQAIAISAALRRGVPLSDEVKGKISLALKGVPLGKFSDAHRANMSAARIAYFAAKRAAQPL